MAKRVKEKEITARRMFEILQEEGRDRMLAFQRSKLTAVEWDDSEFNSASHFERLLERGAL